MNPFLFLYMGGDFLLPLVFDSTGEIRNDDNLESLPFTGDYSLIGNTLKRLYETYLGSGDTVDTVYVFSEDIKVDVRKALIYAMMENGFRPVSYLVPFTDIVMEYVKDNNSSIVSSEGDLAVIFNAVGDSLVKTTAVFSEDKWVAEGLNDRPMRGFSDDPVKDALVRKIIEKVDARNGFITKEEEIKNEFSKQKGNIDRWLERQKEDMSIFIDDYVYHFGGERKSVTIDGKEFVELSKNALSPFIQGIQASIDSNVRFLVFCGKAFESVTIVEAIKDSLKTDIPIRLITPGLLPEVFKHFKLSAHTETCDLDNFEKEIKYDRNQRKKVSSWVKLCPEIKQVKEKAEQIVSSLRSLVEEDEKKLSKQWAECLLILKKEHFDPERDFDPAFIIMANGFHNPNTSKQKQNAKALLEDINQRIIPRIGDVPANLGKVAKEELDLLNERLNKLITQSGDQDTKYKSYKDSLDKFRNNYPEYTRLIAQLSRPIPYPEKQAVIRRLSEISPFDLPSTDIPSVRVRLDARIDYVKKGWFSKKKILVVDFQVIDAVLPCDAVLNVAIGTSISVQEKSSTCLRYEINKDEHSFHEKIDLAEEFPKAINAKALEISLWPSERVMDTSAIQDVNSPQVPRFVVKL